MKCIQCNGREAYRSRKYCNPCSNRRSRDPVKYAASMLRGNRKKSRIVARRKRVLVDMGGGGCAVCSYNKHLAALDFHHVGKKSFQVCAKNIYSKPFGDVAAEAKQCTVLCSNCHRIEHATHM